MAREVVTVEFSSRKKTDFQYEYYDDKYHAYEYNGKYDFGTAKSLEKLLALISMKAEQTGKVREIHLSSQ